MLALLLGVAANPTRAEINVGNVAALTPKWTFTAGVTAQPVLANGPSPSSVGWFLQRSLE